MLRDFYEVFMFPCIINRQSKPKQNKVINGCGHAIPCPLVMLKLRIFLWLWRLS